MRIPEKITSDLAYISGVLAGDSSIYHRKNKSEYVIKCVGNPLDEVEFYNEVLKQLFMKLFGVILNVKHHDSKTTYGFTLYSKDIYKFLTEKIGHPSGKKYATLRIPKAIRGNPKFERNFINGLFDTDGCVTFKRKYKKYPYYPTIIISSKSKQLIKDISLRLKIDGFACNTFYDYKINDRRFEKGYSIINRIELNGSKNLEKWLQVIGVKSPKHISKIKKNWEGNSEGWI